MQVSIKKRKKIELFLCLTIRNHLVMKQLPAEDENNKTIRNNITQRISPHFLSPLSAKITPNILPKM